MKSPVILRVYRGQQLVEVKQFDTDQIVIGHDAEVQLDLDHESVSSIHCLIERRDQIYYVCDLGSTSGTQKNGVAILDEPLSSGDEVQIGPFRLVFFVGVPKPRSAPAASATATVPSIPQSAPPKAVIPARKEPVQPVESVKTATQFEKPILQTSRDKKNFSRRKSKKTFAPPNQISDMQSFIRPTKGNVVEVMVSWKGRILGSYHFRKAQTVRAPDLELPMGLVSRRINLLEIKNGARVFVAPEMSCEVISNQQKLDLKALQSQGKVISTSQGSWVRIDMSEVLYLTLANGQLQLIIRWVPTTPVIPVASPLLMSSEEITGLILCLVFVILLGFTISATTPPPEATPTEDLTRVAQVIFTNPPPKPTPLEIPKNPPPPSPTMPPPPEKAKLDDQKQQAQNKGAPVPKSESKTQMAQRAREVAPIPDSKNKPKKFTSAIKGGAIKLGQQAGANAQSSKDVTKMGLFSAFGGGGIRKKVDEAYSGAGEMLGQADKASGQSGMNENRNGDDLGSKFKDTGAGGKGTATQGIAGIGTKGRSTGMTSYGATEGFGDKTSVNIEPGGAEEKFQGTIDREAIRRAVLHNINQVRGCFVRELSKLDVAGRMQFEGKVVLSWDITAKGIPKNVRVKSSTLKNASVENCIRDRLANWIFPEPPVGMTAEVLSYPFYLRPGN